MRMTQILVADSGLSELVTRLRDKNWVVEVYDGKTMSVDDVRLLVDDDRYVFVIDNAEHLNSYCEAALLKDLEEGQSSYIFFTKTVIRMNPAIVSRCQKVFFQNHMEDSIDKLWKIHDNVEKDILKTVLGLGNKKRRDIYTQKLDYSKLFYGIAKAYTRKDLFEETPTHVWDKIEKIIMADDFRADRRALWYLMGDIK